MVNTLELPFRKPSQPVVSGNPLSAYAGRFGALPDWFDEIPPHEARYLARRALRAGIPLSLADHLVF